MCLQTDQPAKLIVTCALGAIFDAIARLITYLVVLSYLYVLMQGEQDPLVPIFIESGQTNVLDKDEL